MIISYFIHKAIQKGFHALARPTYCLWKSDFQTEADLTEAIKKYTCMGFRVVTYQDGQKEGNLHDGLKAIIKNHSKIIRMD